MNTIVIISLIIIALMIIYNTNPSILIKYAYSCGRQAEQNRRIEGYGSLKSILLDEEGITYLQKAAFFSIFRKKHIKKLLIRVCIGVAEDYLQRDDIVNSVRISKIIYKYGSSICFEGSLGAVEKPTRLGNINYEQLDPLVNELSSDLTEKINEIKDVKDDDRKAAIEISSNLRKLIYQKFGNESA